MSEKTAEDGKREFIDNVGSMQHVHSECSGLMSPIYDRFGVMEREDVPEWLARYVPGRAAPLSKFFSSRVVYYPGSRMDASAIAVFGLSGGAHCFLMVDYLMPESEIEEVLRDGWIDGYEVVSSVPVSRNRLFRAVPPSCHLTSEEQSDAAVRSRMFNPIAPYARFVVLQRIGGDERERFAVLFLCADGIATFDSVFCSKRAKNFFGMFLIDHGFGCNCDKFGHGGLMEKPAIRTGTFPEYIFAIVGSGCMWPGYEGLGEGISEGFYAKAGMDAKDKVTVCPMYVCGDQHRTMFFICGEEGEMDHGKCYGSVEELFAACKEQGVGIANLDEVMRFAGVTSRLRE